jgi:signal transduction histidine kinase
VAETIGALLVEARSSTRALTRQDFDDVRTLIEPQATKKRIALDWTIDLPESLSLPAGFVRQILINLLLNAVQAVEEGGRIEVTAAVKAGMLDLTVANSGPPLPEAVRAHLFEPFVSGREGGHGLGLWVTYQIVTQLGGQIVAAADANAVRFTVTLPLEKLAT